MRKPFQGVWNIIRFNRHFYFLSAGILALFIFSAPYFPAPFPFLFYLLCCSVFFVIFISLFVSWYVYDLSGLYQLHWLDGLKPEGKIVTINAGLDETSVLLNHKFKNAEIIALDFYDPLKHTEISIKRARKAYPPFPGTQQVKTNQLPLENNYTDTIFLILAAHEIRDEQERIVFFKELHRILKPEGRIFITEHLRDPANFLAYNIGFFHFHSRAAWYHTFQKAEFKIQKELKQTPFISTFILEKNGASI